MAALRFGSLAEGENVLGPGFQLFVFLKEMGNVRFEL